VPGIEWLRLMYAYPHTVGSELTALMREQPKMVRYLDIPIQHISSPMLRAMKRGVSREQVEGILWRLRDEVPGIAVRTTLIVGFPGETDADFEALCELCEQYQFERLGVFCYSREEGTPAHDLHDQVPAAVAEQRRARLMAIQKTVMDRFQSRFVGRTEKVLVDGCDAAATALVGRTRADAPEVDCRVLLPRGSAEVGEFVDARITAAQDYDLRGEVAVRRQ
jgi:ribosomal protein S12 methylthiotransferase